LCAAAAAAAAAAAPAAAAFWTRACLHEACAQMVAALAHTLQL
jgi:hypothetical protein